jgi:ACS family hexuronate transporter-like MFS transporter
MRKKIGNLRWTICALLFFATTINYLDRAVISYLKPDLKAAGILKDDAAYANAEIAFKIAYALGLLMAGKFIDKVGTKKGYSWATGLWSFAAVITSFAKSFFSFSAARAALGVTEAGNFPAAIKTTAEWFPKKERAFATGLFNSGANIGAIAAPLTIPFIAAKFGWEWSFAATGLIGFIWIILWKKYYHTPANHPKITPEELAYINSDNQVLEANEATKLQKKYTWGKLLGYKQTWAFAIGKFLTDPIWLFYIFWLPDFLESTYHLKKHQLVLPSATVFTIAAIGSIGGGWLPLKLISKNWTIFKARKTSMFMYALLVIPILFAQYLGSFSMWYAVIVIGIAAAAHQAWSANIFTTVSDMFPKHTVGTVTGIGGMFGALGGILLSLLLQKDLFQHFRAIGKINTAYYIMFAVCALSYLLAWVIMHLLVPKVNVIED